MCQGCHDYRGRIYLCAYRRHAAGCVVSCSFSPRMFRLPKKGGGSGGGGGGGGPQGQEAAAGEVAFEEKLSPVFALGSQDKRISGEAGAGWVKQWEQGKSVTSSAAVLARVHGKTLLACETRCADVPCAAPDADAVLQCGPRRNSHR